MPFQTRYYFDDQTLSSNDEKDQAYLSTSIQRKYNAHLQKQPGPHEQKSKDASLIMTRSKILNQGPQVGKRLLTSGDSEQFNNDSAVELSSAFVSKRMRIVN